MPITTDKFRECLMLYGTDMDHWPQEFQAEARCLSDHPSFRRLIAEQEAFDDMLRHNNPALQPGPELAHRIIRTAYAMSRIPHFSLAAWLEEFIMALLPRPAFALAGVLALGVFIGLMSPAAPASKVESLVQAYFEDDGEML